jgi:hypothetical protein
MIRLGDVRWLSLLAVMTIVVACARSVVSGPTASVAPTLSEPSVSPVASTISTPSSVASVPGAAWPQGAAVPAELSGVWYFPLHSSQITLRGTEYEVVQSVLHASGNVVVNGDEIDFFNGSGCGLALPDGVGRYRWSLKSANELQFTALDADPCGRVDILAGATWTRSPTPE